MKFGYSSKPVAEAMVPAAFVGRSTFRAEGRMEATEGTEEMSC
jgi:hypothetical protein